MVLVVVGELDGLGALEFDGEGRGLMATEIEPQPASSSTDAANRAVFAIVSMPSLRLGRAVMLHSDQTPSLTQRLRLKELQPTWALVASTTTRRIRGPKAGIGAGIAGRSCPSRGCSAQPKFDGPPH